MSKIFKNQTALRFYVNTGLTLSGNETILLKYINSRGTTGSFPVTIVGQDAYYDVVSGDINSSGKWTFYCEVTFLDGTKAEGERQIIQIYE